MDREDVNVVEPSFALGTFSEGHEPFAGLVVAERVLALDDHRDRLGLSREGAGSVSVIELLDRWDQVFDVLTGLARLDGPWLPVETLHVQAPLVPRQILQAGANYRTHVIDLAAQHADPADGRRRDQVRAEAAEMMDRRAAEGIPYFFTGLPSAITGPYDDVQLPAYSRQHDWELELVAVIGRPAFRVGREQALEHVAGYTMANDLTSRDLVFRQDMPEIGTDWFRAKNAPGFLPLGPYLVPARFLPDLAELQLTLRLNGKIMQDESTKDMVFDVATLVSAASQTARLLPGDLILTGSPAGNGLAHGRLLREGDVMESTITGLGLQRTTCTAENSTKSVGIATESETRP